MTGICQHGISEADFFPVAVVDDTVIGQGFRGKEHDIRPDLTENPVRIVSNQTIAVVFA